jgi:hypothetical protein
MYHKWDIPEIAFPNHPIFLVIFLTSKKFIFHHKKASLIVDGSENKKTISTFGIDINKHNKRQINQLEQHASQQTTDLILLSTQKKRRLGDANPDRTTTQITQLQTIDNKTQLQF